MPQFLITGPALGHRRVSFLSPRGLAGFPKRFVAGQVGYGGT